MTALAECDEWERIFSLGSADLVFEALKHGFDPNCRSPEGCTPLFLVEHFGHIDCALVLFHFGADVNVRDNRGRTVLTKAISDKSIRLEDFFIRCGAVV